MYPASFINGHVALHADGDSIHGPPATCSPAQLHRTEFINILMNHQEMSGFIRLYRGEEEEETRWEGVSLSVHEVG